MSRRRALSLAALALSVAGCAPDPGSMTVRKSVQELLSTEGGLRVLEAAPGTTPEVALVTPSIDPEQDGADRLAYVLPPPARAAFTVDAPGPVHLVASAGVDLSLARALVPLGTDLRVAFELRVNGEPRFQTTITTRPKRGKELYSKHDVRHEWQRIGGERGLALEPGDEVELRTSLPDGLPAGLDAPIRAAFSDLRLERVLTRPRTRADVEHPNIVLIVLDTLRADRTTLGGYTRDTTPQLERLARRGLVFDAAYAPAPWTWPTTASLFTGLLPEAHGVLSFRTCLLARELETLAEVLQDAGWSTAAFSGNPLISPSRDFDQGFEHFDARAELRASEAFMPDALAWLERHAQARFFLYLHLVDPHSPHVPRAEDAARFCLAGERDDPGVLDRLKLATRQAAARGELLAVPQRDARVLSNLYDASVASADHQVGLVLDALARLGLERTTLVAVTSDHGEELGDHGGYEHSHTLYEELLRVPLVLAGPGVPVAERRGTPVSNRHLGPTLARAAGVRLGPDDALDLLEPGALPERSLFFDTRKGLWNGREPLPLHGVRRGPWKYVLSPEALPSGAKRGSAPGAGEQRLFHLQRDPLERRDLARDEPDLARELRALLLASLAHQAKARPRTRAAAGAATLEILRGLGYVGDEVDAVEEPPR